MSNKTSSKHIKLSDDLKDAIYNLFLHYSKECLRGRLLSSIHRVYPRICAALKLPERVVRRVVEERENACVLDVVSTLHRSCIERKSKPIGRPRKFDDFDESTVRQTVHDLYRTGQFVSLEVLMNKLKIKGLDIARSTLYRLLKKIGFRYLKNGSGKRFVSERADVIAHRHSYLREIRKYREEGWDIVYSDETWLNANHACKGEWSENNIKELVNIFSGCQECGRYIPTGKGKRLIIVDAGSEKHGYIDGAKLVFLSKTKSDNYHDEMNGEHYLHWFENQLLKSLPEPSVIVLDNAPYHNLLTEESKCPTSNDNKETISLWLKKHNINFDSSFLKAELIELVKRNRPEKVYVTDSLAMSYGHFVLRLPVKHCELNPIELIQAELKCGVARKNRTFKINDVKALFCEVRDSIGVESWKKAVRHVIGIEDQFWKTDGVRDESVESVSFLLSDSDSSDEFSDSSSSSELISENGSMVTDDDSESESVCIVCNSDFPPQLQKNLNILVNWAKCNYCDSWVHLKYCCKVTKVLPRDIFACPSCTAKLKNKEPEP